MSATSTVDEGSVFTCTVLVGVSGEPSPVSNGAGSTDALFAGKAVPVVEGSSTARQILALQLGDLAMSCVCVATGPEAVSLVRDGGATFDIALLDDRVQGPDGVTLATTLQQLPAGVSLPLVLLAGLGAPLPGVNSGFAAVVHKPVKSTVLRQALVAVLAPESISPGPRRGRAGSSEVTSAKETVVVDGRRQRILLVEDNLINQKIAQLMLKKLGHRVDTVGNGQEAVDAVRAIPYEVILMDVQMPVMDGLEATRQIRASSAPGAQPYIIAMTASALLEDRAACLAAGMDSHLPKPVREAELRAAIPVHDVAAAHLS